ncbi:hypothetical protein ACJW30_05G193300 [Castanea mollissima]
MGRDLWSSNVLNSVPNSSATLLDSGNLVLQRDATGAIVWESFQHPCDTLLPRMKLSNNLSTNQKIQLTTWKSPSDPSTGRFSACINPQKIPQGFIWKDGHPYWRTGPWNGQFFTGAQSWFPDYHSGFTIVYDKEETVYATFAYVNVIGLSKYFLDSQGNSKVIHWDDEKEDWGIVESKFSLKLVVIHRNSKVIITITVIIGAMVIPSIAYFLWRWMTKKRGNMPYHYLLLKFATARKNKSRESLPSKNLNDVKLHKLPAYSLEELATATNKFHVVNMLAEGKLHDGQEIAVKRLSRSSGQGLEEFMNEVFVISKLHHRNLVRLLGCCIEGEENMLIYEYMSNKSLDAIVFDPLNQKHLDWIKHFNIIEGNSRGLLCLHRDSRTTSLQKNLRSNIIGN